jgi:hypothetical protein
MLDPHVHYALPLLRQFHDGGLLVLSGRQILGRSNTWRVCEQTCAVVCQRCDQYHPGHMAGCITGLHPEEARSPSTGEDQFDTHPGTRRIVGFPTSCLAMTANPT